RCGCAHRSRCPRVERLAGGPLRNASSPLKILTYSSSGTVTRQPDAGRVRRPRLVKPGQRKGRCPNRENAVPLTPASPAHGLDGGAWARGRRPLRVLDRERVPPRASTPLPLRRCSNDGPANRIDNYPWLVKVDGMTALSSDQMH